MASSTKPSGPVKPGVTVVNLASLSLTQLDQLKTSMDEEVSLLTTSMAQLKIVQQKFVESKAAIAYLSPATEGKEIMVPLTSSMYVPGLLKHNNRFICDIGTGFYIEKEQKNASEFFQRKIDYLTTNIEKLQVTLQEKHKLRESVITLMQSKLQQSRPTPQQQTV